MSRDDQRFHGPSTSCMDVLLQTALPHTDNVTLHSQDKNSIISLFAGSCVAARFLWLQEEEEIRLQKNRGERQMWTACIQA